MGGGKPWKDEENEVLLRMIAEDFPFQEILDSGEFSDRTAEAIRVQIKRLGASSPVRTRQSSVQEIMPSEETLSLEQVVKLFSSAFKQMCASKEVDKYKLERFRLTFQAARDYGPLLAHFEKWDKIEKKIEELQAAVAELRSEKGVANTCGDSS